MGGHTGVAANIAHMGNDLAVICDFHGHTGGTSFVRFLELLLAIVGVLTDFVVFGFACVLIYSEVCGAVTHLAEKDFVDRSTSFF